MRRLLSRMGLVFLAMVTLDVAFATYVVEAAAKNVFPASYWAAAIQLCNVFVVGAFVKDVRMAVPTALGAFAGTWIALTWI